MIPNKRRIYKLKVTDYLYSQTVAFRPWLKVQFTEFTEFTEAINAKH